MRTILLAAGGSEAYAEAGYFYPKNLVEVAGKPLVQHVIEYLGAAAGGHRLVAMVRREEDLRYFTGRVIRLVEPTATVRTVDETSGAACTALLAVEHIEPQEPLLLVNGDQVVLEALDTIVDGFAARGLDAGVVVFAGVHPRWSYVRVDDDDLVIEASEKRPISRLATAGAYWFARGAEFVECATAMIRKDAHVGGLFYVCPTLNEMVLRNRRVGIHRIERTDYLSLHDPQALAAFEAHLASGRMTAA
jgi:dTDP-glucose pyrophosphorylase